MVSPRLHAIEALDRGLLRQGRRAGGLIQRGRVVSVDDGYNPPLLRVALHLRGGQSVTIPNVQTTQMVYDFDEVQHAIDADKLAAMVRPVAGNEVLLLCPSGRAADEAYVVGLATTATALTDSLAASVDGYATVGEAGLTVGFSIPAMPTQRLLTVDGVAAVLGAGARVSPTIEIGGEVFVSTYEYPLLGASGTRSVTFAGRYQRTVGAGRAVVLQATFGGDGTVPLLPWDYEVATTDTAPVGGELVPQSIGGRYPVAALYGRIG